jgi:hypothetical protein
LEKNIIMEKTLKPNWGQHLKRLYIFLCLIGIVPETLLVAAHPALVILTATVLMVSFFIMMRTDYALPMVYATTFFCAGFLAEPGGTMLVGIIVFLAGIILDVPGMIGYVFRKK